MRRGRGTGSGCASRSARSRASTAGQRSIPKVGGFGLATASVWRRGPCPRIWWRALEPSWTSATMCRSVGGGAAIAAFQQVSIGDGTRIGPYVIIMDTNFHGSPGDQSVQHDTRPVTIGAGCRIGSRVTITRGGSIGDGAEILAGSVVSSAIPAARARAEDERGSSDEPVTSRRAGTARRLVAGAVDDDARPRLAAGSG
jgi:Acetyltransferase (isoleucine patch superfamily)